jgi:hypothetical protein
MTLNEAKEILGLHNEWRRDHANLVPMPTTNSKELGLAIDRVLQGNEIAQNIRHAAINWPQFLGDVECDLIASFFEADQNNEYAKYIFGLYGRHELNSTDSKVFMLLVAEALES